MHVSNITIISALPLAIKCCDPFQPRSAAVALQGLNTHETDRSWIYDTGAATWFIGYDYLAAYERKRTSNVSPMNSATAGGLTCTTAAVMCNVPSIGERVCHVIKNFPLQSP